jgi:hypothetical protein
VCQNKEWFLLEIVKSGLKVENPAVAIFEKKLTGVEADDLLKELEPDSAFRHTQWELNNLPDQCSFEKNGQKSDFWVTCSSTSHLLQYSSGVKNYLYFYSPQDFYETCYPYIPAFKILKRFVNTTTKLSNLARKPG